MGYKNFIFAMILVLFCITGQSAGQALIEGDPGTDAGKEINHETGYLAVATGVGDAPSWATTSAMKFAWSLDRGRVRAMANLAQQIGKLYITSENRIEDFKEGGSEYYKDIRAAIETIVLWAEDIKWAKDELGNWTVRLGVPIDGPRGVAEALRPVAVALETQRRNQNPQDYAAPDVSGVSREADFTQANFSGIVVDARGIGRLNPVQFPRILSTTGRVVYSVLNADYAAQFGAVGYGTGTPPNNVNPARLKDRIGNNPFVIKAQEIRNNGDLVVSAEDAGKIAYIDQNTNVLKECRVAFVLDQLPKLSE